VYPNWSQVVVFKEGETSVCEKHKCQLHRFAISSIWFVSYIYIDIYIYIYGFEF